MTKVQIFNRFSILKLNRTYIVYSIFFGLSTLVVPLGVQFLVNNLALSGIWLNTISFIIMISAFLLLSQVIRHSQFILNEFLQREIFVNEVQRWKSFSREGYEHYFFENLNLIKAFSNAYTSIVEMSLVILFGLFTIVAFNPFFIVILLLIILFIYQIFLSTAPAIRSSIHESNRKYALYESLSHGKGISDELVSDYLDGREKHFIYVRKNSFKISLLTFMIHLILLSIGIYLIQQDELSVGQLVSAEFIVSGILSSLSKLPKTLESVYDYETSLYKLNYALGESST